VSSPDSFIVDDIPFDRCGYEIHGPQRFRTVRDFIHTRRGVRARIYIITRANEVAENFNSPEVAVKKRENAGEKGIKPRKEDSLSVRFGDKNSRAVVVDARAGRVNSIRTNPIKRRSTRARIRVIARAGFPWLDGLSRGRNGRGPITGRGRDRGRSSECLHYDCRVDSSPLRKCGLEKYREERVGGRRAQTASNVFSFFFFSVCFV